MVKDMYSARDAEERRLRQVEVERARRSVLADSDSDAVAQARNALLVAGDGEWLGKHDPRAVSRVRNEAKELAYATEGLLKLPPGQREKQWQEIWANIEAGDPEGAKILREHFSLDGTASGTDLEGKLQNARATALTAMDYTNDAYARSYVDERKNALAAQTPERRKLREEIARFNAAQPELRALADDPRNPRAHAALAAKIGNAAATEIQKQYQQVSEMKPEQREALRITANFGLVLTEEMMKVRRDPVALAALIERAEQMSRNVPMLNQMMRNTGVLPEEDVGDGDALAAHMTQAGERVPVLHQALLSIQLAVGEKGKAGGSEMSAAERRGVLSENRQ